MDSGNRPILRIDEINVANIDVQITPRAIADAFAALEEGLQARDFHIGTINVDELTVRVDSYFRTSPFGGTLKRPASEAMQASTSKKPCRSTTSELPTPVTKSEDIEDQEKSKDEHLDTSNSTKGAIRLDNKKLTYKLSSIIPDSVGDNEDHWDNMESMESCKNKDTDGSDA